MNTTSNYYDTTSLYPTEGPFIGRRRIRDTVKIWKLERFHTDPIWGEDQSDFFRFIIETIKSRLHKVVGGTWEVKDTIDLFELCCRDNGIDGEVFTTQGMLDQIVNMEPVGTLALEGEALQDAVCGACDEQDIAMASLGVAMEGNTSLYREMFGLDEFFVVLD